MRVTPLVATFAFAASCGGEHGPAECQPRYATNAKDEPLVSDEAWRAIADAEDRVKFGGSIAPLLLVPAEDQTFRSDEAPPVVTWETPSVAARPSTGSAWPTGLLARWWRRIAPVGAAWAHGSSTTGDVFWAEILVPGRSCPLSFVTTGTAWPLSDAEWSVLTETGGAFDVRVTYAYLTENVILESDGPFRASANRRFSVEP